MRLAEKAGPKFAKFARANAPPFTAPHVKNNYYSINYGIF
jgi:hypothetical protein